MHKDGQPGSGETEPSSGADGRPDKAAGRKVRAESAVQAREDRLKRALKANMARRKAQAASRADKGPAGSGGETD
jgi:hypothetical protein